jgi:hypothetical protein
MNNELNFGEGKSFTSWEFNHRHDTYGRYCIEQSKINGLWLEFGVATGATTKKFVQMMPEIDRPLYGFDSFMGLPETWDALIFHQVGAFSTNGVVPEIKGAEMVIGLFNDTLPNFITNTDKNIAVLIIDCDIYSSTKTIFDNCKNKIVPGTIILFDELFNYPEWKNHEYKAFIEFVEECGVEYEWVAYVENSHQACCKITKINQK